MRRRVAWAFGAAAVVVGLAPAATATHHPAVAGETVVVVRGAAKMKVTLPERAQVLIDTAKSVEVDGGGRLVGVLLRENHEHAEEAGFVRLPAQLGGKVYGWGPTAAPQGCEQPLPAHTDCSAATFPAHYDLRRGTYTLYAFTDGAPARVTLRFANYGGSVVLDPRTPVDAGSATYATSVGAPAGWSGGAAVRTEGPGLLLSAAWWTQDDSAVANAGSCWYDGSDGLPGPYRYVPGCPSGSSVSGSEVVTPVTPQTPWGPARGGRQGALGLTSATAAGTYGLGQWVVAQNVRDGGGVAYWLGR